ncbi:ATP-binding protein [Skermanella mucosa]|uniref:ATP-binding protein n=1 Tax=Skermanella mucosa TaxID=1789672 RepID=UPI00389A6F41
MILTGATGTGKTWIACALGNQAAREGFSVLYSRLSRLLDDIATARLGSGAGALMRRLARVDLLILDDWMMSELTAPQRRDLMEIVDDRHDRGSIILASQIPLTSWHRAIGDSTYSEAILDRIVRAAYRVELQGDFLRKPARGGTAPSGSAIDQPTSNLEKTTVK